MSQIIALCGFKNSGKSSIINSVIQNPEIIYSQKPTLIGPTNQLRFGNNDETVYYYADSFYTFLDEPGINIGNADIVLWTTDASSAFITDEEIAEYNKMKDDINKINIMTNKLIQIGILVSKANGDENENDSVIRIVELYPNDIVILYNAYGKLYHQISKSKKYRNMIRQNNVSTHHNIKNINTIFCLDAFDEIYNHEIYQLQIDIFHDYYIKILHYFDKYNDIYDIENNKDQLKKIILPKTYDTTYLKKNKYDDIIMHNFIHKDKMDKTYDRKSIICTIVYIISRIDMKFIESLKPIKSNLDDDFLVMCQYIKLL
jgi:hypothetical protein